MNIEKLSQKIKELRKMKCLSQEELATQAGVSLRTIQRVEKAENTPSGETLKRILTTLGTSYETLIAETITEKPLRTLQGVNEYLHIFSDKLIINRSVTPENITKTYEKSISYLFKTLGVVFIGTLLFSIIAVVLFFLDNTDLAIFAASLAITFLITAFLMMRFSSGIPYIERKRIVATKIEKMSLGSANFIVIYRDGKRIKERVIAFETRDLTFIQQELISESLLENDKVGRNYDFLFIILFIPIISATTGLSDRFGVSISIYGLVCAVAIIAKVIIKSIRNNKKYAQSL
ncbi:helix-turn-helix domain-containing protein [Capnocytophaga canis]|uniref:helix-turn-helix domain-containing protein n=1 Tax=Capnocytophaga canis TaxID=1848903 RepID=UPI001561B2E9|nr:helix-turn-helix transcriptional regulator [Capnocytophaga canis]